MKFSDEYIAKSKAAMDKPAPREALRLLASGRVAVKVRQCGELLIESLDGKKFEGQHMIIGGSWPLIAAGMVDEFGVVTPAGHEFLASIDGAA